MQYKDGKKKNWDRLFDVERKNEIPGYKGGTKRGGELVRGRNQQGKPGNRGVNIT